MRNLFRAVLLVVTFLAPATVPLPAGSSVGGNGLLVVTGDPGGVSDIFTMDASGEAITNLTNTPNGQSDLSHAEYDAAWAPDGQRIVFARGRDIWTMNPNGTGQTQLTHYSEPIWVGSPSWSPDGSRILFERSGGAAGDDYDIFVMRADGTQVRNLTKNDAYDAFSSWSPDGRKISFKSGSYVWLMNPDGTGKTYLDRNVGFSMPAWSPDGRQFAGVWGGAIATMPVDDSDDPLVLTPLYGGDGAPVWSPDGSSIAFERSAPGGNDIYLVDPDGSVETNLTPTAAIGFSRPDWQPVCTVNGTNASESLSGGPGRDLICGRGGNDHIVGAGGNDVIFGGAGKDEIAGGSGNDVISGGAGADSLAGNGGIDLIDARDTKGSDELNGGPSADACLWDTGDVVKSCP